MDHPRFEPVKGTPAQAHQHYYGGGLVDVIFRLIDRRGSQHSVAPGPHAQVFGKSAVELHERLRTTANDRPDTRPPDRSDALDGLSSGPLTSRDFLLGSARTGKLQTALLAGLVIVLGIVLVQVASERPDKKTMHAQHALPGP